MTDLSPKAALRAALKRRRAAIDRTDHRRRSTALTRIVQDSDPWRTATSIAAFVGVRSEPDTAALLQATLDAGKHLWLPRVVSTTALTFVPVTTLDDLAPGAMGLWEPRGPGAFSAFEPDGPVDLVLFPGLGFDRHGARLGFGRGHYDRALAPARDAARPVRMGLCLAPLFEPPDGPIPMGATDVAMHLVATDEGLHDFR